MQSCQLCVTDPGGSESFASIGLRLPAAHRADVAATPGQRGHDGGLVELDIVRQHGDRILGSQADLVGNLVRPADDQLVDIREALRGRERRPAVDDHRLVAHGARQRDQRDGHLDGTDDHQPRPSRETPRRSTAGPPISTVRDVPRSRASAAAVTSARSAASSPVVPTKLSRPASKVSARLGS